MSWTVHISSKEKGAKDLVATLVDRHIDAHRTDVEVADIVMTRGDRTYVHAEIKKASDMLASITDCRYHEQSAAMAESRVPFTVYLVEDYRAPCRFSPADETKIQHALTRLQLSGPMNTGSRSHIGVVYLTTPTALVDWIVYVHKNLVEDPATTDGIFAPLSSRVKHNFGTKPSRRDQARVYVEMLSRVSGLAEDKAKALAAVYPSMSALTAWLRGAQTQSEMVAHLRGLKIGLADKAAEALYTQLLAPSEQTVIWTTSMARGGKRKRDAEETFGQC
jgi:ERCC4-type nuclease